VSAPARCDGCGAPLLPDSAFCHACGKAVAPRIAAADGEHKRITVLFIDAFGSIGLGDRLDAEQWHDIMESFFSVVSIGVQRFGGTVDRLTGEGIKVLFGAPAALENHASQACHAALHIAARLGEFATSFRARAGVEFSVRMGLNSGEVVFGRVGVDSGGFTSQGHTAALAARMQQLAEPGQIYLTESTATLVKDFFELREMGSLPVRNANQRVQVFELLGARAHRSRLDAARDRGLSPFIGRDVEVAELDAASRQAVASGHRVVGVVGEPGVGKSRLIEEFVERQRAQGAVVDVVRCAEHARWIPFHAAQAFLRGALGVDAAAEPASPATASSVCSARWTRP
jgi:class 3 adenylate cyclase